LRQKRSLYVVLLAALIPVGVQAQTPDQPQDGAGFELEQNYPNPFNPETKIPFVLGEDLYESGRPAVVTIRILNMLQQLVATPTALNHSVGEGVPVEGLEYAIAGRHEAFWDGKDHSGAQVASGVYFIQLVVNGRSAVRRMFVSK